MQHAQLCWALWTRLFSSWKCLRFFAPQVPLNKVNQLWWRKLCHSSRDGQVCGSHPHCTWVRIMHKSPNIILIYVCLDTKSASNCYKQHSMAFPRAVDVLFFGVQSEASLFRISQFLSMHTHREPIVLAFQQARFWSPQQDAKSLVNSIPMLHFLQSQWTLPWETW